MEFSGTFRFSGAMTNPVCAAALLVGLSAGAARGTEAGCVPVEIVEQPASMVVLANCQVTFRAGVTGSAPYAFQWLKDGNAIDDATNASYTTPPVDLSDNGSFYPVMVRNGCGQATSSNATLIIALDVGQPKLIGAVGGPTLSQITLSFEVGGCPQGGASLDSTSATDSFNYVLSGGLEVIDAKLAASGTVVVLTTASPQTEGATYTVTVNGVADLSGNTIPPDSQATFRAWVTSPGFLLFESKSLPPPVAIITDPCVINCSCGSAQSLDRLYLTAFDSRTVYPDDSHDNYCARVTGFFIPPQSGNWIFYLRSD